MLSINKILFTILVIALVWYGFKWLNRVQAKQRAEELERARADRAASGDRGRDERAGAVEDMVACSKCGAFVPARGARSCGKTGCPFPE